MPDGRQVWVRTAGTRALIPDDSKEAQEISMEDDGGQPCQQCGEEWAKDSPKSCILLERSNI
jgi:hypothetical protein